MDIHRIAVREAAEAYRKTLERGRRALELLASDAIHPDGGPTAFEVESQSGPGPYSADVDAGTGTCADHEHRGVLCQHLQAAELYAHEYVWEPMRPQAELKAVMAPYERDPMDPDWERLAREDPTSQQGDSADAAGPWSAQYYRPRRRPRSVKSEVRR